MSPKKKKPKLNPSTKSNKRTSEPADSPRKRLKPILSKEEEIKARRKKNFITACEEVSGRNYFDHRARLLLIYLPSCIKKNCNHHDKHGGNIKQMPTYADESFKTEMKNNMWYEALEVCHMCITPTQYLSSDVLKDVVEIMLNAHEDEYSEYTTKYIIEKCQQVLMLNFSTHPPCLVKSLRNCYNSFLISPMTPKENTFTNRSQYECNKGIVKYCMNRLEHELSADSKDEPLVDKDANIPEEMKESVRGLHWQKENFEIFELLNRQDRIERLFTVLETIIELLQFDLVIWHSRYTKDLGRHIMRSHKPLMAYVLWSDNVLYTGAVTNNCRQILRIFAYVTHLQYPDSMVKVMTCTIGGPNVNNCGYAENQRCVVLAAMQGPKHYARASPLFLCRQTWLNTMVQTFYICEANSNMDYPNTSKYCAVFANDFYKIISEMPHDSITKILERIEPTFMRHLVGLLHVNKLLSTNETCIIRTLINFINQAQWKLFLSDGREIKFSKKFYPPKTVKRKLSYLWKKCETPMLVENTEKQYSKMEPKFERSKGKVSLNHIIQCLYITLEAYLDAYDLQSVQDTWSKLNEQLLDDSLMETDGTSTVHNCYTVTETLVKKYRNILQSIKELVGLFGELKNQKELPEVLNIFGNIVMLDL